jgi:TPR repeat protein
MSNIEQAVMYYKEAAILGHPGACVNLSNCYDSGVGVCINKARVFELDTFAAEQGHPIALNNLGCCNLFGKGCQINHNTKIKLWMKASGMGYSMSQVNLGRWILKQ